MSSNIANRYLVLGRHSIESLAGMDFRTGLRMCRLTARYSEVLMLRGGVPVTTATPHIAIL
jgi:hypothetical protein